MSRTPGYPFSRQSLICPYKPLVQAGRRRYLSTFRLLSELREYPINSIALALMYLFQTAGHRRIVQELRQHLLWCFFSISKFSVDLNIIYMSVRVIYVAELRSFGWFFFFFFCLLSLLFFYTTYTYTQRPINAAFFDDSPLPILHHFCRLSPLTILFLYNKNQGTLGDFFDNSSWPSLSSFLSSFVLLIVLPCCSRSHSPWNIIATWIGDPDGNFQGNCLPDRVFQAPKDRPVPRTNKNAGLVTIVTISHLSTYVEELR